VNAAPADPRPSIARRCLRGVAPVLWPLGLFVLFACFEWSRVELVLHYALNCECVQEDLYFWFEDWDGSLGDAHRRVDLLQRAYEFSKSGRG